MLPLFADVNDDINKWLAARPLVVAAGAAVYASYFYKFERPYQAPISANFTSLDAVQALVTYVFTYVGTPLAAYGAGAAAVCGAAGTVLFVGLAARLRTLRDDPAYRLPMLLIEADGVARTLEESLGAAIKALPPQDRRKRRVTPQRRPRFLMRRKPGNLGLRLVVNGDEIIAPE